MPNVYKIIALVLIAAFSLGTVSLIQPRMPVPDPANTPTVGVLYAAPVERVETHVLGTGQTLNHVLAQARITGQEMADLLLGIREHYNPRRLTKEAEVTVRRWARTDEPRVVEVRVNRDSTIRLVKAQPGGWNSEVVITPTYIDTVYTGGTIDRGMTLIETMVLTDSRLPVRERYELAYQLADVYAFKLDFQRDIHPGDSYRVVFERETRPDGSARSSRVLAADMSVQGQHYAAVWFDGGNDTRGYFDDKARPLAHGFSKYPVGLNRITSRFNPNRYHPILGQYRAHNGTDFGAPTGTPVRSVANGTVTFAGTNGGYGRMIEVRHFNGYTSRYAHLSRFNSGVRVGARVAYNEVIGYVGATGLATAPHLHYELRKNGRAVNPARERIPDAPPLTGAVKTRFLAMATERSSLLERIPAGAYYADNKTRGTTAVGDEL